MCSHIEFDDLIIAGAIHETLSNVIRIYNNGTLLIMMKHNKSLLPILITLSVIFLSCSKESDPSADLFDENFQTRSATIIPVNELNEYKVPFALTRLENDKISLMIRNEAGKMSPFFVRGIETGFWDTRKPDTDYDLVFENFAKLNSNTALFMVHWWDIEPEDGVFDFSFTDMIAEKAAKNGVKIWWVLFLHTQPGLMNVDEDAWMYRVSGTDEADNVLQWVKDDKGGLIKTLKDQLAVIGKQYHAYGHPEILSRTVRMLKKVAEHYKDNENVIGVQIGNEEGFNTRALSDYNPHTLQLYDQWRNKTGKVGNAAFKRDLMNSCWKQYTTAFHEIDPYKLTSFNIDGGSSEYGSLEYIKKSGTASSTYREGNLDVIGTMFYRQMGDRIWHNLDMEYLDYTFDLPILIPSEIGIGRKGVPRTWGLINILRTIERGGMGYAVYCYEDMHDKEGNISETGRLYRDLATMIKVNEDILCEAVPGNGNVKISSDLAGLRVSQLKGVDGDVLSILYFPELTMNKEADDLNEIIDINLSIEALLSGSYTIDVYHGGEVKQSGKYEMEKDEVTDIQIPRLTKNKAIFVTARLVR